MFSTSFNILWKALCSWTVHLEIIQLFFEEILDPSLPPTQKLFSKTDIHLNQQDN